MTKYAYYKIDNVIGICGFGMLRIGYNDDDDDDDKASAITVIDLIGDAISADSENVRCELSDRAYSQLTEYFAGNRTEFDFPFVASGTEFQKKVWNALLAIPYGETRSYKQIASYLGNPKASRAVGMAAHRNPLCIVIPCHRVVGSDGSLTGYAGGLDFKAMLLKIESENMERVTK